MDSVTVHESTSPPRGSCAWKVKAPVAAVDLGGEVERGAVPAVEILDRCDVRARGGDGPLALPRIVRRPLERDGPVLGDVEPRRGERDLGVAAGVEEVLAVDDVRAELGRPLDRDRVDAGAAGEARPVRAVLEPGRDVLEAGSERADAHVPQLGLEGRVVGIGGEAAP